MDDSSTDEEEIPNATTELQRVDNRNNPTYREPTPICSTGLNREVPESGSPNNNGTHIKPSRPHPQPSPPLSPRNRCLEKRPNSPNSRSFEYNRNELLVFRHHETTSTHILSYIREEVRKLLVLPQNDKPAFVTESKSEAITKQSENTPDKKIEESSVPNESSVSRPSPIPEPIINHSFSSSETNEIMPEVMGRSKKEEKRNVIPKYISSSEDEYCNSPRYFPSSSSKKVDVERETRDEIMAEVIGTSGKGEEPVTFLASFKEKDADSEYDEEYNAGMFSPDDQPINRSPGKEEQPVEFTEKSPNTVIQSYDRGLLSSTEDEDYNAGMFSPESIVRSPGKGGKSVEFTEKVINSPESAGLEPATDKNTVTKSLETKEAPITVIQSSYGRGFLSSTEDEDYNAEMFSPESIVRSPGKGGKPVEFTEKGINSPESAGLKPATDKNSVTKSLETKEAPITVIQSSYGRGFLSSTEDEDYNASRYLPNSVPSKKVDVKSETSDEDMNSNCAELPIMVLPVSPSDRLPGEKSKKSSKKEKAEDSDGAKRLKRLMKKVKSKKQRDKMTFEYEMKKLNGMRRAREKKEKKEKEANEKAKRRNTFKRIDRSDVQEPTKIIDTPAPQRPFPENMCNDDHDLHGHAFQLLDAMFPGNSGSGASGRGSRNRTSQLDFCPWRNVNYNVVQNFLQESRDLRANLLRTFPKPVPDALNRLKQTKTLESLRKVIWAMHFRSQDPWNQKTVELMTRRTMFYADEEGVLWLFRKGAFSMIWSDFMSDDRLEVMEQRRPGWMLRPVFVDGHSLLSMFFPESTTFPKIPVKILLHVLMHFLLDGHKVTILLSDYYKNMENVDDVVAFEFLIEHKLVEFIPFKNVKHVETYVLEKAEMVNGIIVTTSEDVSVGNSRLCHPVINRFSNRIDDFLFLTVFSRNSDFGAVQDSENVKEAENVKNSKDVKNSEDKSKGVMNLGFGSEADSNFLHHEESSEDEILTDENYVKINRNQAFARKCRLYSNQEIEKLVIENCNYQLTIEEQVFLISSLCHFTDFHLRTARLIRAFLTFINKYSPDLIPAFMSVRILTDITDALENIRDARNPDVWPIFRKH